MVLPTSATKSSRCCNDFSSAASEARPVVVRLPDIGMTTDLENCVLFDAGFASCSRMRETIDSSRLRSTLRRNSRQVEPIRTSSPSASCTGSRTRSPLT